MSNKRTVVRALLALALTAVAALAIAGSAQAKLTGEFTKFQYCPWKNTEVRKCLYAVTEGGEVVLGSKKVPIVNPVVLQGGYSRQNIETKISKFYEATNGVTLAKVSQPVPGGLAGLVNCKEISNFILKASCELVFENGLTGVNSTLELARPASEIQISELNLSRKENLALQLPVKFRLENPLLGSECYVGSSSNPIIWNLTTGLTSPPEPNKPIEGSAGEGEFLHEGEILALHNDVLVDNAWAAPGTSGCGGLFSFILDPIINASSGLPAAAGHNTAILKNDIQETTPAALEFEDETHP